MNVVFIEPSFPRNQREFVRALAEVGATVYAVGETPWEWLDDELRGWIHRYEQVGSVTDVDQLREVVTRFQGLTWIDALEATIESHTLPAAIVREDAGIPGTSVHTTWLCRDKPSMKEALRAVGVPTAASAAARDADEVRAFAARVGYPIVLKPRDGAGAASTVRAASDSELTAALSSFEGVESIAVEEFVEGHEGFYDTVTVGGHTALDFACHYYPNVLEAMRTRWISPQYVSTNRVDEAPFYGELREMGERVHEALGITTSATHMEWFNGPKGLRFSEIGARPPGVGCSDLYSVGNDVDLYRAWADSIVHGRVWHTLSRRMATGIIALRPTNDGVITGVSGVEWLYDAYGQFVIDAHIPQPGTPTQPVEAGYMANAWVRLKHPDYDVLRAMLDEVGGRMQVHA